MVWTELQKSIFGNLFWFAWESLNYILPQGQVSLSDYTSDEKCYYHVNLKQQKEWVSSNWKQTPRVNIDLYSHKTMICVWWDCQGASIQNNLTQSDCQCVDIHSANEKVPRRNLKKDRIGLLTLFCNMIIPIIISLKLRKRPL